MIVRHGDVTLHVSARAQITFGRSEQCDITIDPSDLHISRTAGVVLFEGDSWVVENAGRRTFFLVEPGGEIEVSPTSAAFRRRILHQHCWLRVPGSTDDHAIVLTVSEDEMPSFRGPSLMRPGEATTAGEQPVKLTDNERRSTLAIYEGYLRLPPHHTRRPNSFRAVGARLGVEEGKVKADHRRVADKVITAGGPTDAHSNRDALIAWLLTRQIINAADVSEIVD